MVGSGGAGKSAAGLGVEGEITSVIHVQACPDRKTLATHATVFVIAFFFQG
jgi:hypothetical protein